MIKLTNILTEILNTYQVEAYMLTSRDFNITDVLDQVRAVQKITIVRNLTPPEYTQPTDAEYTLVSLKFITRGDAREDMEKIKQDILTSDREKNDLRVPGVKSFKYKEETLKRL